MNGVEHQKYDTDLKGGFSPVIQLASAPQETMMTTREQKNPRCFACAAPTGVMCILFFKSAKCETNPGFTMFC